MAPLKAKKKAEPKAAKAKTAAKSKPKAAAKAKPAAKALPKKAAAKPKAEAKGEPKAKYGLNESQKESLLILIDQIVDLRRKKKSGLRSFFMIDRILDKYNQKYVQPDDKFDAIVRYGVEKNDNIEHPHTGVFVFVDGREKDETNLFKLLTDIHHDKLKFEEIKTKLRDIYTESQG